MGWIGAGRATRVNASVSLPHNEEDQRRWNRTARRSYRWAIGWAAPPLEFVVREREGHIVIDLHGSHFSHHRLCKHCRACISGRDDRPDTGWPVQGICRGAYRAAMKPREKWLLGIA